MWRTCFGSARLFVTPTTSSLIEVALADQDTLTRVYDALVLAGGGPAFDADRQELSDVFGSADELRNGFERTAEVVLVQPADNHPLALEGKGVADFDQALVEELGFVDTNDLGFPAQFQDLSRKLDHGRRYARLGVTDQALLVITSVDAGFEDHDPLAGDESPAQSANQLFGLTGEHASTDHFDPSLARADHRGSSCTSSGAYPAARALL